MSLSWMGGAVGCHKVTGVAQCPECNGNDRPIVLVKEACLLRQCAECGHRAWEEIPRPAGPTIRKGYITVKPNGDFE